MSAVGRPGTFERVYGAIKQWLREGRYRPGDRLEPAILSDELNASVTPVRDALHRLTGERILEAPPHEGFRVPLLTETALRQLYGWHQDLLILALLGQHRRALPDITTADAAAAKDLPLFHRLGRMAANAECRDAIEGLLDRLEPIRRLEGEFLDGIEEETRAIVLALERGSRVELRAALLAYHRRRARIVPKLLERIYAR